MHMAVILNESIVMEGTGIQIIVKGIKKEGNQNDGCNEYNNIVPNESSMVDFSVSCCQC